MDARTVVTGGFGYIGRHVVRRLSSSGVRVAVLARQAPGRGGTGSLETILADVRDATQLAAAFRAGDVVIHLACLAVGPSRTNPVADFEANARGTFNVLEAGRAAGIRRVVVVSSAEVYGTPGTDPVGEDHPLRPTSPYGASKASGDLYAGVYRDVFGVDAVVLRLFNVFGPAADGSDRHTVETIFARKAAAGAPLLLTAHPDTTRDFVFIDDVVSAIVACAGGQRSDPLYNIGSGEATTLGQLAMAAGYPAEDIPAATGPAPAAIRADITRARRGLGFEPTRGVREYVRELRARFDAEVAS